MSSFRRRLMMAAASLPYDAEVEYIQSDGTSYIELPYGFQRTDELYLYGAAPKAHDKYLIAPKTWNNNNNRFGLGGTVGVAGQGYLMTSAFGAASTNETYFQPATVQDEALHTYTYASDLFTCTDLNLTRSVSGITFSAATDNLRLFYGYNANTAGKIGAFWLMRSGAKIVDLIAVRKRGVGYLYDKVSGTFYTASGFTYGPDKS